MSAYLSSNLSNSDLANAVIAAVTSSSNLAPSATYNPSTAYLMPNPPQYQIVLNPNNSSNFARVIHGWQDLGQRPPPTESSTAFRIYELLIQEQLPGADAAASQS